MGQFVNEVALLVWHGPGGRFDYVPTVVYCTTELRPFHFFVDILVSSDSAALIAFKK